MKTLACFLVTWITATALLLWLFTRHGSTHFDLGGAQLTFTDNPHWGREFWRSLWIACVYSVLNTFIVRFWQMQTELRKGG
jgi:hypothetical protein